MSNGLPSFLVHSALAEAQAVAERLGVRVGIAIVDAGGNLAGFLRIPGAFLASSDLAIDKAWTAASFGTGTRGFSEMLESMPRSVRDGLLRRPRVTEVPGGLPLIIDGELVGAVGVSGGSEIEDEQIAEGALTAFSSQLCEES